MVNYKNIGFEAFLNEIYIIKSVRIVHIIE